MLTERLSEQTNEYQTTDHSVSPKPLVLIVENHADSRSMLKTLIEIWGYRVAEAENGEESIDVAISECPNLILMDVSLAKMDGLTTVRRMRGIDELGGVPIVFISGHAQPELRTFALAVGGDDFLVKPIDFSQLEFILKKFMTNNFVNSGGLTV